LVNSYGFCVKNRNRFFSYRFHVYVTFLPYTPKRICENFHVYVIFYVTYVNYLRYVQVEITSNMWLLSRCKSTCTWINIAGCQSLAVVHSWHSQWMQLSLYTAFSQSVSHCQHPQNCTLYHLMLEPWTSMDLDKWHASIAYWLLLFCAMYKYSYLLTLLYVIMVVMMCPVVIGVQRFCRNGNIIFVIIYCHVVAFLCIGYSNENLMIHTESVSFLFPPVLSLPSPCLSLLSFPSLHPSSLEVGPLYYS